jgi:hypothetical protein
MKSKLSTALAAAGCSLAFSVGATKADTTFDIFATFTERAGGTLSGAMTIGPNIANVVSVTGMNVCVLTLAEHILDAKAAEFDKVLAVHRASAVPLAAAVIGTKRHSRFARIVSNTNLGTHFDQQYGRPLDRTLMIEDLGQALRSETMNAVRSPCVAACP